MNTKKIITGIIIIFIAMITEKNANSQNEFKTDKVPASGGDIELTFISHGSIMISYNGKTIQVDPVSEYANYTVFPKADIILITHHHFDHMDTKAIKQAMGPNTQIIFTEKCKQSAGGLEHTTVLKNGSSKEIAGLKISAVPAYNIEHKRPSGEVFHPKGEGNGYVIEIGGKKIYIAGDTENIPEMKNLKNIDIAFLPMNLPYTMSPEMAAKAAKSFDPKILYPYHYGDTDTQKLVDLLKNEKGIEVRIRDLK